VSDVVSATQLIVSLYGLKTSRRSDEK
jgi:hypothetical protein